MVFSVCVVGFSVRVVGCKEGLIGGGRREVEVNFVHTLPLLKPTLVRKRVSVFRNLV